MKIGWVLISSMLLIVGSAFATDPFFQPLGNENPSVGFFSRPHGISGDGSTVVGVSRPYFDPSLGMEVTDALKWSASEGLIRLDLNAAAYAVTGDGSLVVGSKSPNGTVQVPNVWSGSFSGWTGSSSFSSGVAQDVSDDGSVIVGGRSGQSAFGFIGGFNPNGSIVMFGGTYTRVSADGSLAAGILTPNNDYSSKLDRKVGFSTEEIFIENEFGQMLDISRDGSRVLMSHDGSLFTWVLDPPGTTRVPQMTYSNGPGQSGVLSWDGSYIAGATGEPNGVFLWDEMNGQRNLANLLQQGFGFDLEGWNLQEATGISDDGKTIVGYGINPDGQQEAWIVCIPEPSSWILLCGGLAVLIAMRWFRGRQPCFKRFWVLWAFAFCVSDLRASDPEIITSGFGGLQLHDSQGNTQQLYTSLFAYFTSIELGPDGDVYALDHTGIYKFSGSDFSFLRKFDSGYAYDDRSDFAPPNPTPREGTVVHTINFDMEFGPDGNIYVTSGTRTTEYGGSTGSFSIMNKVLRFDGQTGQFMDEFIHTDGDLDRSIQTLAFDGHDRLLVSTGYNLINRYDAMTGVFIDSVSTTPAGAPSLGPDGNIYILSDTFWAPEDRAIYKMDGTTGASLGKFIDLSSPALTEDFESVFFDSLAFDLNGNLYLSMSLYAPTENAAVYASRIARYNGQTGEFMDYVLLQQGSNLDATFGPFAIVPVPEPSPLALAAVGAALGVLWLRCRRRY